MTPVGSVAQAFEAIDRVKAPASAFCTNFFPVQKRLEAWVKHGELFFDSRAGAVFFYRRDRDFWHLYFGAANVVTLIQQTQTLDDLKRLPLVTDIVGEKPTVAGMIEALEPAGFRRYGDLQRMARAAQPMGGADPSAPSEALYGKQNDCEAVMRLLDASFDRFADQLPTSYEIGAALENRQILVVRSDQALAAMLFFETQGLSSTLRYWAVAGPFRSKRLGSALMRDYIESQAGVRRFILWVAAGNRNAVEKYEHYGYKADGLIDHVLCNKMIPA